MSDLPLKTTQRTVYTGEQFRREMVRPVLQWMRLWSPDAEELILGTAAQETHLGALGRRQSGGGPALGICQCEPHEHEQVIRWTERNRPALMLALMKLASPALPVAALLVTDDRYAIAVARLLYLSIAGAIPHAQDLEAQCSWYLRWYNNGGKATRAEYLENYRRYVLEQPVEAVN